MAILSPTGVLRACQESDQQQREDPTNKPSHDRTDGPNEQGEREGRRVALPEPKEPISAQIDRLNQAVAEESCERLAPLLFTQARPLQAEPGGPPVNGECQSLNGFLRVVRGVTFNDSSEFGTAAIVEGPARQPGISAAYTVWVVDRDAQFRMIDLGLGSK